MVSTLSWSRDIAIELSHEILSGTRRALRGGAELVNRDRRVESPISDDLCIDRIVQIVDR